MTKITWHGQDFKELSSQNNLRDYLLNPLIREIEAESQGIVPDLPLVFWSLYPWALLTEDELSSTIRRHTDSHS